jgi:hypothetical protein
VNFLVDRPQGCLKPTSASSETVHSRVIEFLDSPRV